MTSRFALRDTQLYDIEGQRLYLCISEDKRFLDAARHADRATHLFCELLSYTGARISEALATTPRLLDIAEQHVVFRTLKRRSLTHYRTVPIPSRLMRELASLASGLDADARLWPWSRTTAWRRVKGVMVEAGITGAHAMPKGIRHKYGVAAVIHGLPETMLQELLGHADLATTAIYVKAVGREKRALVSRVWQSGDL